MLRLIIVATLALVALSLPAEASARQISVVCNGSDIMRPCAPSSTPAARRTVATSGASQVIGGRPKGCPHAFCGCGASLHLFGRIIPSLNLAANWLRFPHASPAPRMAAVRRHHVFVLEQHIGGSIWLAFDANSGGHATRMHERSISGYVIVNPSGAS